MAATTGGGRPSRLRVEMRNSIWPGSAEWVWDRKENDGYVTMPRILPLIMGLIKEQCDKEDASSVYLDLWSRSWDEGIVEIFDEEDCAYSSGYRSKRALRTWRERIRKLEELGYIFVSSKGNKCIAYILIINPIMLCSRFRREERCFPDGWWPAFVRRIQEIGAVIPEPASPIVLPNK